MNFETLKYAAFFVPTLLMPIASTLSDLAVDPEIQKLAESGGYLVPVALLSYGIRYLKEKVDKKEEEIKSITTQYMEEMKQSTTQYMEEMKQSIASRVTLAQSLEKHSDAIAKMSETIEKLNK